VEVISIANQKGGTGKTTTAVNLGSYLALNGKKTLVIDMDPQGAATAAFGINKSVERTTYDVIVGNAELSDVAVHTEIDGLDIVPSNIELCGAELELAAQVGREYVLQDKMSALNYEYSILDTPPSLGLLTVNAMVACSSLIIPIQTEYYALEGMSHLMRIIDLVRNRLGNPLRLRVLLTMYDRRTKLSKEVADQVREHFKDWMFKTVIPRNVRLAEAPSYGKPICLYDPACKGAQAYEQLAKELIGW
jgi:chromosome partitioning protein